MFEFPTPSPQYLNNARARPDGKSRCVLKEARHRLGPTTKPENTALGITVPVSAIEPCPSTRHCGVSKDGWVWIMRTQHNTATHPARERTRKEGAGNSGRKPSDTAQIIEMGQVKRKQPNTSGPADARFLQATVERVLSPSKMQSPSCPQKVSRTACALSTLAWHNRTVFRLLFCARTSRLSSVAHYRLRARKSGSR